MNPNDLIAQQQAIYNQAMQNQQNLTLVIIILQIAFLLIGSWVVYMFYARLRDIADELCKMRIIYEFANEREEQRHNRHQDSKPEPADNPFQKGGDAPFQPK